MNMKMHQVKLQNAAMISKPQTFFFPKNSLCFDLINFILLNCLAWISMFIIIKLKQHINFKYIIKTISAKLVKIRCVWKQFSTKKKKKKDFIYA